MCPSWPDQKELNYTRKQSEILQKLDDAIAKLGGIEIVINPKSLGSEVTTVALDVEHDESGGFVGCGFYSASGSVCYFSDLHVLNDIPIHSLAIVAHNGISDLDCLRTWGINVNNEQLMWDSMLIGHILDSSLRDYSLKGMAKRELGIEYPSYDDIVGKRGLKAERITLDKQPLQIVSKYNALDVIATWKLYERQKKYEIL